MARSPLPNRVLADGRLVASHTRGTLMGNRGGRFHDPETQTVTKRVPWVNKQWISCVLQFKDRHRTVWTQGYTELFFLDEATALSAGHRPCFECRRKDAKAFQLALFGACADQEVWESPPKVASMDALLHQARTSNEVRYRPVDQLPIGAMFEIDREFFAITPVGTKRWTLAGYEEITDFDSATQVRLVTPAPIVAALAKGYAPGWHTSGKRLPAGH